ncbi:MAG: family 43 glycosylhydrolase [Armatimonadota bacterium]
MSEFPLTYCNPIPLPNYPRGRACRDKSEGWGWRNNGRAVDFRETADPSVLFHDGKWYLYPSCGMAWVSEDFCSWRHAPMNLDDVGYAPTIMEHKGTFYLTASGHPTLYRADNPLGPWEHAGTITDPDGEPLPNFADPMYFADDDGRVYLYWGCGGAGILGAEMDSDNPARALTPTQLLIAYNPDHVWERYGPFNEDPSISWMEGAWMFKSGVTYYLTYTSPGTQFPTYGMGVYTSASPLGPFTYAPCNPFLIDTEGLVQGPGHGCLVRGPRDTVWVFYTCLVGYHHNFERRIGFDPAGFDADGNLYVKGASEWPQWAPGLLPNPAESNDTGWLPLCVMKGTRASSEAPGRTTLYAVDNNIRTWWQPADGDDAPWLEVRFDASYTVHACRLVWAEPGLDYDNGAVPGPFKYRVEIKEKDEDAWQVVVDKTGNQTDLLIDYTAFPAREACSARLVITGWPRGIRPGVVDFQLFGTGHYPPPGKFGVWPPNE